MNDTRTTWSDRALRSCRLSRSSRTDLGRKACRRPSQNVAKVRLLSPSRSCRFGAEGEQFPWVAPRVQVVVGMFRAGECKAQVPQSPTGGRLSVAALRKFSSAGAGTPDCDQLVKEQLQQRAKILLAPGVLSPRRGRQAGRGRQSRTRHAARPGWSRAW
jgi:hypothetical protein